MSLLSAVLLAWIPFVHPLRLPASSRLWMLLPLVACVAVVYRVTRARAARELPWTTVRTFVNIVLGMCALAVVAYLLHEAALHFTRD